MNLKDTLQAAELILESDSVPLIVGETGIGKTALVKELAKLQNAHLILIDANILKEGEIGGLPTTQDYRIVVEGKELMRRKTVYALHTKLLEIDETISSNPDKKIILFIDELNRCEHAVQQELMNLVLNREINGYKLPQNAKVIAAMNPSSKYDKFASTEYQVVDMDPAQEDRFTWLEMDTDTKIWLNWGLEVTGKFFAGKEVENIHHDILEFIASFPELLHTPNSQEAVKATPRSWERVSDSYRTYLAQKEKYQENIFYNVIKGNIGPSIAQEFIAFFRNSKEPLIKPEEIFSGDKIDYKLVNRVKNDSHSRLYLTSIHALKYLESDKEDREKNVALFVGFLQLLPGDLRMAIMQEIKFSYEKTLYNSFMQNESFVNGYFKIVSLVKEISEDD